MPVTINGTTGIQVPLGSASAPSDGNTSNPNTGLYFPTGTSAAISTNGTTALSIDSSQNVTLVGSLSLASVTNAPSVTVPNISETTTVSATAATGTINFDVTTQSVLYYTTSASGNWTLNVRGNSSTQLNTVMATNQTITIAFLVTNGATPYYASAFTIDGSAVTPKYQGGTAFSAGNASSVDVYTYTITKTASATYTVLASQTQFK